MCSCFERKIIPTHPRIRNHAFPQAQVTQTCELFREPAQRFWRSAASGAASARNSAITNARRSSVCSAVIGAWHALAFCRLRTKMLRYQIAAGSRNGNDEDAG